MGLCKCPKSNVTNLFCYEHRVNVCQHCMVTNHPKCIVRSYIHWLHDSDYNPVCTLCNERLASHDCVRLLCYHVFHWACLNQYCRQLPETTAPAGYVCPSCNESLFPQANVISPVAKALREKLALVNWARAGLGLPLLSEEGEIKPIGDGIVGLQKMFTNNSQPTQNHLNSKHSDLDIIVHVEDTSNAFNRSEVPVQIPRRTFHGGESIKTRLLDDDDNKYRRRSPADWIHRWLKSLRNKFSLPRGPRRSWLLFLIIIIVMCFIIMLFSTLGRIATADDPSLNPNQNPLLHVG